MPPVARDQAPSPDAAPAPCGCVVGHPRIRLLDQELGVTHAISGMVVLADSAELRTLILDQEEFRLTDRGKRLMTTEGHEYAHYLQAVGSAFLQFHGHERLRLAVKLLRAGPSEPFWLREFRRASAALAEPGEQGLTCLDILESGAVLTGHKVWFERCRRNPDGDQAKAEFRAHLEGLRATGIDRRYYAAFDWLERRTGFTAAYHHFHPLSFVAFNSTDPVGTFVRGAGKLAKRGGALATRLLDATARDVVDALDSETPWLADRARLTMPAHEMSPATEAAFHIVEVFGLDDALELILRPWHLDRDRAPTWATDAVAPLALVWSSAGGLVEAQLSDLASQDEALVGRVMYYAAVIGAAERISDAEAGRLDRHRPCPHHLCPHHAPALCTQFFFPPPLARHHDTCNFVQLLANVCGRTSAELWAQWGLPAGYGI
jgi:hypothetical protein